MTSAIHGDLPLSFQILSESRMLVLRVDVYVVDHWTALIQQQTQPMD